jgi:predicted porin
MGLPGVRWAIRPPTRAARNLIRYDSPTLAGFVLSASIGEAGDYWGVMPRYAGEFSGFRVAAGIGYEDATDKPTGVGPIGTLAAGQAGPANLVDAGEVKAWGAGRRSCTYRPACSRKVIT